ncbi:MAG: hypothetical protein WCS37_14380, partial [Chloroflexota bacterium]
ALGLIIDARGRPIKFATDLAQRRLQVQSWHEVYSLALQQAENEDTSSDVDYLNMDMGNPSVGQPMTELVTGGGTPLNLRGQPMPEFDNTPPNPATKRPADRPAEAVPEPKKSKDKKGAKRK